MDTTFAPAASWLSGIESAIVQVLHSQLDDAGAFAPGWRISYDELKAFRREALGLSPWVSRNG